MDVSLSRTLFEKAIRLEPSNALIWRAYEAMESTYGSVLKAEIVLKRALQAAKMNDRRFVVSEPQAGDFAPTGTWITEDDLRMDAEKSTERKAIPPPAATNEPSTDESDNFVLEQKPKRSVNHNLTGGTNVSRHRPKKHDQQLQRSTAKDSLKDLSEEELRAIEASSSFQGDFRALNTRLNLDFD